MPKRNGSTDPHIGSLKPPYRVPTMQEVANTPLTAAWNEELLRTTGFRHIECFWCWVNFAAWIAVR